MKHARSCFLLICCSERITDTHKWNSLLNQVTGAQCLIKHSLGVIAECNFSALLTRGRRTSFVGSNWEIFHNLLTLLLLMHSTNFSPAALMTFCSLNFNYDLFHHLTCRGCLLHKLRAIAELPRSFNQLQWHSQISLPPTHKKRERERSDEYCGFVEIVPKWHFKILDIHFHTSNVGIPGVDNRKVVLIFPKNPEIERQLSKDYFFIIYQKSNSSTKVSFAFLSLFF